MRIDMQQQQQQEVEDEQFHGVSGGFHQFLVEGNQGIFAALHNGNRSQAQFLQQIVQVQHQQQQGFLGGRDDEIVDCNTEMNSISGTVPVSAAAAAEEEEEEEEEETEKVRAAEKVTTSAAAVAGGSLGVCCSASAAGGGGGGNRWPREETLALLRIRSAMESSFRDSTIKGPLWENVSRRLAELGYQRSAKKCKEKFENINKYYRKTKDGKKSYRFCTELEALFGHARANSNNKTAKNPNKPTNNGSGGSTSEETHKNLQVSEAADSETTHRGGGGGGRISSSTTSTSSRKKRRRRMASIAGFFQNLVDQVITHQEQLHSKFLEAMDRRDQERLRRDEEWKRQEMARLDQESELRAQEKALASTREATIMALLHKIIADDSGTTTTTTTPAALVLPVPERGAVPPTPNDNANIASIVTTTNNNNSRNDNNNGNNDSSSVSWPDAEIQTLMALRISIGQDYPNDDDSCSSGKQQQQLWEEVSSKMCCLGFQRSASTCRQLWESISQKYPPITTTNNNNLEDKRPPLMMKMKPNISSSSISISRHHATTPAPYQQQPHQLNVNVVDRTVHNCNSNNNNHHNHNHREEDTHQDAHNHNHADQNVSPSMHSMAARMGSSSSHHNEATVHSNPSYFQGEQSQSQQSQKRLKMSNDPSGSSSKNVAVLDKQVKEMLENLQQRQNLFRDDAEAHHQSCIDEASQQHQRNQSQFTLIALVQKLAADSAADYAAE